MYRKLLYVKLQWNKTSLSHIDTSVNCLLVLFNHKFIHFDTVWSDNLSILDHNSNLPGVQGLIFESWINIRKVGSISNFHHLLSFAHATCFSNNNMWWLLFHHQLKSNKKLNKVLISDTLKKNPILTVTHKEFNKYLAPDTINQNTCINETTGIFLPFHYNSNYVYFVNWMPFIPVHSCEKKHNVVNLSLVPLSLHSI